MISTLVLFFVQFKFAWSCLNLRQLELQRGSVSESNNDSCSADWLQRQESDWAEHWAAPSWSSHNSNPTEQSASGTTTKRHPSIHSRWSLSRSCFMDHVVSMLAGTFVSEETFKNAESLIRSIQMFRRHWKWKWSEWSNWRSWKLNVEIFEETWPSVCAGKILSTFLQYISSFLSYQSRRWQR